MSRIRQLDQLLQRAKGKAANVYGQTYDQYRLSNQTPNSGILNGLPIASSVAMSLKKAQKTVIEGESFSILTMNAMVDNRNLQIGDLLLETGYEANAGVYAVAQIRPLRATLLVRCEQTGYIIRPTPLGGNANQMPPSGASWNQQYGGYAEGSQQYATIQKGTFTFAPSGAMAELAFNLTPTNRIREMRDPKFATQVANQQYLAWIPAYPGLEIRETDYFQLTDDSLKLKIVQLYQPQNVGFTGYTVIVEEMLA